MRPQSWRFRAEARRSVVVNPRFRLGAGQVVRLKDGSVSGILARSDPRVTPPSMNHKVAKITFNLVAIPPQAVFPLATSIHGAPKNEQTSATRRPGQQRG